MRRVGIYDTYITEPEHSNRNLPALAGGLTPSDTPRPLFLPSEARGWPRTGGFPLRGAGLVATIHTLRGRTFTNTRPRLSRPGASTLHMCSPRPFSSFQECEDAPQRAAEEYARSVRGSVPPTPTLYMGDRRSSRKLARVIGNDEAPGLFAEGSYRYSVLSTLLDATNHHLNLLAQWFIFCLGVRLEPLRVLAI